MANNMDINTSYRSATDYNSNNNAGVTRQKKSFKQLLFGDNSFVAPNITIGDALKTWHTAAGKAE